MADSSGKSATCGNDYSEPVEDPYKKAISYLERHNILQLFQHLTSDVIFHRPDDPLDYLIKEVQQMKAQRYQTASK
ncbi:hypothetical protein RRG08_042647 [Elysia crispata]|uniref:Uncharacterized protein n=1 Tax=Elysia crispata TaxID=231223 RepID=A0AAE0XQ03_9GAST|nr:hypothetical protein RRG08_042647 [Elysia crispata]